MDHSTPTTGSARLELRHDPSHFWKNLGIVLGTLISAGVVISVLFNSFYVKRDEYQAKSQLDSITQENVRKTLDNLNESMKYQREAFERFSDSLNDMKTDVAVLKSQKRR